MTLEKEIEKKLCNMITSIGGLCLKFADPTRKGAPDRLVLFEGKAWFIELKRPTGVRAKLQKDYAELLSSVDHEVIYIYSFDDLNLFFDFMYFHDI